MEAGNGDAQATARELKATTSNVMNQSRAFAEGVVVMVCPVLLALALEKVDLKKKDHGRAVPLSILVIAGATLITGICPLLACCCIKKFPDAGARLRRVSSALAPVSSACLVSLACLIAQLIIPSKIVIPISALSGLLIVIHTACSHSRSPGGAQPTTIEQQPIAPQSAITTEQNAAQHAVEVYCYSMLDSSHEFLCAVTGILFLGLEGLALEGQISISQGIQPRLRAPMGITLSACALGVVLMFLEMVPPYDVVSAGIAPAMTMDAIMAGGTVAVLLTIMIKPIGVASLLLLTPLFILLMYLIFRMVVADDGRNGNHGDQEPKPASLELTKVTFTGFLAVSVSVSVSTISSGAPSPSVWTTVFLGFAAAAIVSGLAWRLLTHHTSAPMAETANVASFLAHLCVAVATVPFAVMAAKALS